MAKKKRKNKIVVFSLLGIILIGISLWAFVFSKHEEIITIQTEKVSRRTITQIVTATGKIRPELKVDISPEVSGEIVELPIVAGEAVKEGQLLFRIKPDIYRDARDQAAAGVSSAQAQSAQMHANVIKTDGDYKRAKQLYDLKLESEADLATARDNYDVAVANEDAAKHNVESANANLEQAEETLRKTTVVAPMSGTITALNSQLGERVLGTQQFNGTNVCTISDLSSIIDSVNVDENDVVLVHIGDTAHITVDAFPDRQFTGIVYQIANTALTSGVGTQEEATNFEVDIRINDKDVAFRPGMSANAIIETQTKYNVLAVPLQSVTTRISGFPTVAAASSTASNSDNSVHDNRIKDTVATHPPTGIFLVMNNIVKYRQVKTGISDNSYAEVLDSLSEGDEVVSGSFKAISKDLEDGKKVKVDNTPKNYKMTTTP